MCINYEVIILISVQLQIPQINIFLSKIILIQFIKLRHIYNYLIAYPSTFYYTLLNENR